MNNLLVDRLPQLLSLVEEWRPIVGYEESYEISNTGKVRSVDRVTSHGHRRKGQEMKLKGHRDGHFQVGLWRDGKPKFPYVHRLVVQAFRGEIPEGSIVRHLTDDPDLNLLPMLEAGSPQENMADKVQNSRCYMTNEFGSRTHCPRGHQLDGINLKPSMLKRGQRECLACTRAKAINRRRKLGYELDSPEFQALSDEYYRANLAGFTSPTKFYKAVADTVTT